eukprot:351839-Chlamydomonas_euryale.AAC.7
MCNGTPGHLCLGKAAGGSARVCETAGKQPGSSREAAGSWEPTLSAKNVPAPARNKRAPAHTCTCSSPQNVRYRATSRHCAALASPRCGPRQSGSHAPCSPSGSACGSRSVATGPAATSAASRM